MGKPLPVLNISAEVAARFQEILPPDFAVEVDERNFVLVAPGGGRLLRTDRWVERRMRPERVVRQLQFVFGPLPKVMSGFPEVGWPGVGFACFAAAFDDSVHVWYGPTDDEEAAVLRVRPIPWAVFGLSRRDLAIRLGQCT